MTHRAVQRMHWSRAATRGASGAPVEVRAAHGREQSTATNAPCLGRIWSRVATCRAAEAPWSSFTLLFVRCGLAEAPCSGCTGRVQQRAVHRVLLVAVGIVNGRVHNTTTRAPCLGGDWSRVVPCRASGATGHRLAVCQHAQRVAHMGRGSRQRRHASEATGRVSSMTCVWRY